MFDLVAVVRSLQEGEFLIQTPVSEELEFQLWKNEKLQQYQEWYDTIWQIYTGHVIWTDTGKHILVYEHSICI